MKASELITHLQAIIDEHGDVEILCEQSQDSYFEFHPVDSIEGPDEFSPYFKLRSQE